MLYLARKPAPVPFTGGVPPNGHDRVAMTLVVGWSVEQVPLLVPDRSLIILIMLGKSICNPPGWITSA